MAGRANMAPRAGGGLLLWLGLAAIVILADQVSKTLIVGWFALGAAGWQRWFFSALGIGASGLIVWMIRSHPAQRLFCFSVSMIMGGALGNVIDRLWHGHVVDFLQFRFALLEPIFRGGYFPSFNLADSAITAGAIGLILDEFLRVRRVR